MTQKIKIHSHTQPKELSAPLESQVKTLQRQSPPLLYLLPCFWLAVYCLKAALMRIWLHVFSPERRMSEKSTMTSVYCTPTRIIVRSLYSLSIIFLCNLFMCIFKWCALNWNYSVFNGIWHWLAVDEKKYLELMKGHFPNSTDVTVQIKRMLQKTEWMILPCKSLIP